MRLPHILKDILCGFSFNYSMIGMYYLYKQNRRKFQIGQQDLCTSSSVI